MPKYDYRCPSCGATRIDVWVSNYRDATNSREPVICECGHVGMEKLPCAPNFQVKGYNAGNGYSK